MEEQNIDAECMLRLGKMVPTISNALITAIRVNNKKLQTLPDWWEEQLIQLAEMLNSLAPDLKRAFEERRLATVAWIARNCLEVSIWSEYCTRSEENAYKFYHDTLRDMMGLWEAVHNIATMADVKDEGLAKMKDDLIALGREKGLDTVDKKFTNVGDAAKEIGREDLYRHFNKYLSKFAHPTALVLKVGRRALVDQSYCSICFRDGVQFISEALSSLQRFVMAEFGTIELELVQ